MACIYFNILTCKFLQKTFVKFSDIHIFAVNNYEN